MTQELFREYLMNMFVAYIQQFSENPVFADELGAWLTNSVGAQFTAAGRKQNHRFCFPSANH
jgi:hypothetical protein